MKVALIGATGKVGARLTAELLSRGHEVTGLARTPGKDAAIPVHAVDANDAYALAKAVEGHDAVMSSATFRSTRPEPVIDATRRSGVGRLLVVGGAGTLHIAPGQLVMDMPGMPAEYLPEMSAGRVFLEALRQSDIDWTFLSPPLTFAPGTRTGIYRLGGDDLMRDAEGASRISYEDVAKALVDELESPAHSRSRFSIAY